MFKSNGEKSLTGTKQAGLLAQDNWGRENNFNPREHWTCRSEYGGKKEEMHDHRPQRQWDQEHRTSDSDCMLLGNQVTGWGKRRPGQTNEWLGSQTTTIRIQSGLCSPDATDKGRAGNFGREELVTNSHCAPEGKLGWTEQETNDLVPLDHPCYGRMNMFTKHGQLTCRTRRTSDVMWHERDCANQKSNSKYPTLWIE